MNKAAEMTGREALGLMQTQQAVARLGRALTNEVLAESQRLYAPYQETGPYKGLSVSRDVAYGDHERHRLDIFRSDDAGAQQPVLLFVHGGGFVGGDKRRPGSPFYDNIAVWAARNGLVGINMTYRRRRIIRGPRERRSQSPHWRAASWSCR